MTLIKDNKILLPQNKILTYPTEDNFPTYNSICLPYITIDQAREQALAEIDKERSGEQLGLYSPFKKINVAQGKYWRFETVNLIFSMTGHGKSFNLMQLNDAFTDFIDYEITWYPKDIDALIEEFEYRKIEYEIKGNKVLEIHRAINKKFIDDGNKLLLLNFYPEMTAREDVVRTMSNKVGRSVDYLLSSEWDASNEQYNRISDIERKYLEIYSKHLEGRPIIYLEMAGDVTTIVNTCTAWKKLNPTCKIIINIDHALLVKKSATDKDDNTLMGNLAVSAIYLRKKLKAMVNIIGQMNMEIVAHTRQTTAGGQYPILTDVHGSKQLGWACDNVICMPYRPDLLNFTRFGMDKLRTKELVVFSKIKSRKGKLGEVYLRNNLAQGKFIELSNDEIENLKN